MKLSELVGYRNLLDSLSSRPQAHEFENVMSAMINVVELSSVQIPNAVKALTDTRIQVSQAVELFEKEFDQLRQQVQVLIEQQEPEYFQNSVNLYNTGYRNDTPEHILNRQITVDPVTAVLIQQRLKLYTSWQHPALILRPAHALGMADLVACDPMYFADTSNSLLELTESWFTPEYQRRLRHYVIDEYNNQPVLENLPQAQFGLIYSFHFFEYRPWPVLQQYLRQCYDLLRPGGVLAFTYNNCDLARRVGMVEHYSGCYTPGRLVRDCVQELGFETVYDYDDDSNTSWMELKRPGMYNSIRGGQTLAAIHPRTNESSMANTIDQLPNSVYNEINILLNIAQRLNIDLKQCVKSGQYSAKKLRRSIESSIYPEPLTEQMIQKLFNQRTQI
jgi:SAM-dependent methyltransferase